MELQTKYLSNFLKFLRTKKGKFSVVFEISHVHKYIIKKRAKIFIPRYMYYNEAHLARKC